MAVGLDLAARDDGRVPRELGRAYLALGRQLVRTGNVDEARQALTEAASILGEVADPDAVEATSLLARASPVNSGA